MPSEPRPHLSDEDVMRLLALAGQDCLNATLETEIRVLHDLQSARAELIALREENARLRAAITEALDYTSDQFHPGNVLRAALRPAPAEGAGQ